MKVTISPEQRFLRKSLKTLDALLSHRYGFYLFDVLSALRGPDSKSDNVKEATTGLIRGKAFPRVFDENKHQNHLGLVVTLVDNEDHAKLRRDLENDREESHHFIAHAQSAFRYLGLSWSDLNPTPNRNKKVKK